MDFYVWYVNGDDDKFLFATKLQAEAHARTLFPDEGPDKRYTRIYYYEVQGE